MRLPAAQLSAEAIAQPNNAKLAAQVATVFKGETLRGLLLNAYAFGTMGMIAGIAAIAAFIAAAVMLILGGLAWSMPAALPQPPTSSPASPTTRAGPGHRTSARQPTPAASDPAKTALLPPRLAAEPPLPNNRSKVPPRLVVLAAGWPAPRGVCGCTWRGAPGTQGIALVGEQHYRDVLAGRGGADVDMKDLVVAEHRRVRVKPAAMI